MQPTSDQQYLKHKFLVMSCKSSLTASSSQEEIKYILENCPKPSIKQAKLDVAVGNSDTRTTIYEETAEQRRTFGSLAESQRSGHETGEVNRPMDVSAVRATAEALGR
jgi:hypothetical protein